MKVALITPGFSENEADWCIPFLYNMARGLSSLVDLHVFAMRYPTHQGVYPFYEATVHAVGGHHSLRGMRRLPMWARALRLLRQEHRRGHFDVIHGMWAEETGMIAVLAGKLFNVPSVVSLVGGELVRLPDIGYGMKPEGAAPGANNWMTAMALHANAVIAPCRSTRSLIQWRPFLRRDVIVPFGVDIERFRPDPRFDPGRPRDEEQPRSGLFGRFRSGFGDTSPFARPFPRPPGSPPAGGIFGSPLGPFGSRPPADPDDDDADFPARPKWSSLFGSRPPVDPDDDDADFPARPKWSSLFGRPDADEPDDEDENDELPELNLPSIFRRRPPLNAGPTDPDPDSDLLSDDESEEDDEPPSDTPARRPSIIEFPSSGFFSTPSRPTLGGPVFGSSVPNDDDEDDDLDDEDDDFYEYDLDDDLDEDRENALSDFATLWAMRPRDPREGPADDPRRARSRPYVGAAPHLIAVGSLIPVKNHALLLRAFSRIQATDATLEIVGEGPLLGDLKQLAEQLGIAHRVTFTGHVPHDRMPEVYRRADLHILPSRHEGFGLVVIEAAACGVPTIGFAVGVLEELAPAWGTAIGYTIEDEAETLLVNRIDDVLTYHTVALRPLRERVRQVVKERYTLAHMVNGVRRVYVEVAAYGRPMTSTTSGQPSIFGSFGKPGGPR